MNASVNLDKARKSLARAIESPHGQFALYPFLERTIEFACSSSGSFAKDKNRVKFGAAMAKLVRVHRTHLKITGGSYAGNEDKNGAPNLQQVVAQLSEEDPDEFIVDKYALSAEYLKGIVLHELNFGYLSTECTMFKEHVDGSDPSFDVYHLLNSMMVGLLPLEALMLGPSICLDLDRHHVLSFGVKFTYTELEAYGRLFHDAFRQVVHTSAMSNDLEAHRREIIKDLIYLSSKEIFHRVPSNAETIHMRQQAKALLKTICITRPVLDAAAVDELMLEFRQQHPMAHLTTRAWQPGGVAPRGRAAAALPGPRTQVPPGSTPRDHDRRRENRPTPMTSQRTGDSTRISPLGNRRGGRGGGPRVTITENL